MMVASANVIKAMITLPPPEIIAEGFALPECPRWHEGALYFSDIRAGCIWRMGADGRPRLVVETGDDFIGGLGFTPQGELMAVLSKQRAVARVQGGTLVPHAALDQLCRFVLNDMVVAPNGWAYISQPGYDIWRTPATSIPPATEIIAVAPGGRAHIAAHNMMSPNGMAVSADGHTLYVAESTGMRVTCFTIGSDGALTDRRIFSPLPDGGIPDGMCLDDAGGAWVAVPVAVHAGGYGAGPGVVRLDSGGRATHLVPVGGGRRAVACAFGGPDRTILHICTVADFDAHGDVNGGGRLERVATGFRGDGIP